MAPPTGQVPASRMGHARAMALLPGLGRKCHTEAAEKGPGRTLVAKGQIPNREGGEDLGRERSSGEEGAELEQRRDLGNLASGGVSQTELRQFHLIITPSLPLSLPANRKGPSGLQTWRASQGRRGIS